MIDTKRKIEIPEGKEMIPITNHRIDSKQDHEGHRASLVVVGAEVVVLADLTLLLIHS